MAETNKQTNKVPVLHGGGPDPDAHYGKIFLTLLMVTKYCCIVDEIDTGNLALGSCLYVCCFLCNTIGKCYLPFGQLMKSKQKLCPAKKTDK